MRKYDENKAKFYKAIELLKKRNEYDDVHSSEMSLLRTKAKRRLRDMILEAEEDCTKEIRKFWKEAIYMPFNYFKNDHSDVEKGTLLTMFVGELFDLLTLSDRYAEQFCTYLGDVHRYMSKDLPQHVLARTYYEKAINERPNYSGRAYSALCSVSTGATLMQKLRLLILAEIAENPYNTVEELRKLITEVKPSGAEEVSDVEKFLALFVQWAAFDSAPVQRQLQVVQMYKKTIDSCPDADWPTLLSVCNLAAQLALKKFGYNGFKTCYEVITDIHNDFYSKKLASPRMLSEALSWMASVGNAFGSEDIMEKHSMSHLMKDKWSKLVDSVLKHLNEKFANISICKSQKHAFPFGFHLYGPIKCPSAELLWYLVKQLFDSPLKAIEMNPDWKDLEDDPKKQLLFRRYADSSPKKISVPKEALVEEPLHDDSWKPVYTLVDIDIIKNQLNVAKKIWEMDDFVHVMPYCYIDKLDRVKKGLKEGRPAREAMRVIEQMILEQRLVIHQEWGDEYGCIRQLLKKFENGSKEKREGDYKHIVGYICKSWETERPMEGLTCYSGPFFLEKCSR